MSGICGIFRRDGYSVDPGQFDGMMAALRRRGPDGEGVWRNEAVALGSQLLYSTPESKFENLPLIDRDTGLVLCCDARIDNRVDLRRELGLSNSNQGQTPDSHFILAAFKKWGENCPRHLIGDYAFVIWDNAQQHLFCARDHLGARPFYYFLSENIFAFASEIKALFAIPQVPKRIKEAAVADFLQRITDNTHETFYRDIYRLNPATTLSIQSERLSTQKYWQPDPTRRLPKATSEEYAEEFLKLFTEAVRCRLRSAYPVGCTLSGGLDSSSVACVARNILAERGEKLHTFSAEFSGLPESDLSKIDERCHQQAVIDQGGFVHHPYRGDLLSPLQRLPQYLELMDEPFFGPNIHLGDEANRLAREQGIRIMLDGMDGDTIVSHGYERLNSLVYSGQWWRLIQEVTQIAKRLGVSRKRLFKTLVLRPYFREPVAHIYRQIKSTFRPGWNFEPIVDPDFGRKWGLHLRTRPQLDSFKRPASIHVRYLVSPMQTTALEMVSCLATPFHIEPRSPFYDRRLMEFCLALPAEEKLQDGWSRFVLRRSMENVLPKSIQWRSDKGDLSFGFARGLRSFHQEELEEMVNNPNSFMASAIQRKVLEDDLAEFLADPIAKADNSLDLYCTFVIHSWLKGCKLLTGQ
ncbi:MAG: asparagine synthase (glutamine-hydrolyzing) [Proteobacteria bacterium]|nr:asparagine synthase (glutamine-hydrolyzing) [Pseudomonadota bacterium]